MNPETESLQSRLFWAFALVTAIAAALPALFYRNALYEDRLRLAGDEGLAQARFAKSLLDTRPTKDQINRLFESVKSMALRMTLADASGNVLRDSHIAPEALPAVDNHNDRPEIESARRTGQGVSMRHSDSLGIDTVYAAVPLADGGIVRMGVPVADIRRGFEAEVSSLGLVIAGVAGFCLALSIIITDRVRKVLSSMTEVVKSMSLGKGRRLYDVPGKEFVPLAEAVNRMADDIAEYVRTSSDQKSQLEAILNSMHEGVLVLGPSGNIRRRNKAMEKLFPAVARADGRQLIEAVPVPALQRRVDELLRARDDGEEQAAALMENNEDDSVHFELPAGRFLVAHLSRPVESTESLGAVIVVYDATEIMRLERMRRDFITNVSHELRTPLTAISGYAETLMDLENTDDKNRLFAGIIHKHATSLARVINDLLSLARVENAREDIRLVPTDPQKALEEALSACRAQTDQKSLRVISDMESAPLVRGNAALLAQTFRNLLENACRYSPEGSQVRVAAKRDGSNVIFTVADNGPGIPPDELPRIFERFYQVEKGRNSGSAGIGLAICKHIIERHGGRIWAESPHEDAATAMLFTLPAADTETDSQ